MSGVTARRVRAAVPRDTLAVVGARAPSAELVVVDDLDDFSGVEFLVPIGYERSERIDELPGLDSLRVVQSLSAGVDRLLDVVPSGVTLCSARGARDSVVADWVMGALLGAGTHLLAAARSRSWGEWPPIAELADATVVILGMGSIGEAVAARLAPFGATVVPVVSRAREGRHGVEELPQLLGDADALVILTPLSASTRGLVDAELLARLPDGALVVNAGRGPVLDTAALIAETAGPRPRLRAVLDVVDPEPLPDGHPLWSAPGVLSITPHIAGDSDRADRLAAELVGDQLARFCAGEPLVNVIELGGTP